jgi:hypothetical protein
MDSILYVFICSIRNELYANEAAKLKVAAASSRSQPANAAVKRIVGGVCRPWRAAGSHCRFGRGSKPKVLTGSEKGFPFVKVLENESGPSHRGGFFPGIAAGVEFHRFARAGLVFHGGDLRSTGSSEDGCRVDL